MQPATIHPSTHHGRTAYTFNAQAFANIETSQGFDEAARVARLWVRHYFGFEAGIEHCAIHGEYTGWEFSYVNTGDTYDETIVRRRNGDWVISSWGDEYEALEMKYAEETGQHQCNYCGGWYNEETANYHDHAL